MSTQDRKERQFLQREQTLLDLALDIMRTDGFAGLSMDKLTCKSDYSKGTIYNHFRCKEDVLSAIGLNCLTTLHGLFSRALAFDGNSRERMLAVHFAYMLSARLKPEQFMCVLSFKTSTVIEKSSQKRQQQTMDQEYKLIELVNSLVVEACELGDLPKSHLENLSAVSFCHWAMSFGTLALMLRADTSVMLQELDMQESLLYNMCVTLDGLDWKPLSKDWDYEKTIQQLQEVVFADEWEKLQQAKL